MELENIYSGKILLVDLEQGACEEEDLDEDLIGRAVGGAAVNLELYRKYMDRDPVVLGTGPLTGTFAPSACAGVVTGKSPVTGRVCHVPLVLQTAVEMKLSGFDFLVILGASEKPVRLWLHDELAEVAGAGDLWGKDVWASTDWLRHEHGDDYVQALVIGPAGENGSPLAQFSEGYWGSRDIPTAMDTCLSILQENARHIDGIKISLLSKEAEITMRRRLPDGIRMYTGDDFNYAELIEGDEVGYSDALLGIFDAIAPAASAALKFLAADDEDRFNALLAPTVPLSRHIFRAPTRFYKTGVVFLAYLNAHQNHFTMVGGQESARSTLHLAELFRLADQAGLLTDPEDAVRRMQAVLTVHGVS